MATTAPVVEESITSAPPPKQLPWLQIAFFTGLVLLLFFPVILPMVDEWSTQEEMGHGFFVVPVAAYIVWSKRDELAATPVKPFWPALSLIVLGFVMEVVGILGAEFFVSRAGLISAIVGVIWALCGWQVLKKLMLPLAVLLFAIRIPLFIYSQMTQPLQLFASQVAETVLNGMGIPCLREGNVLKLSQAELQVVEACSGIRSLISLTFLSVVYGYFFENRNWVRGVLFLLTIPIAILANAGRVTITGILYEYKREWAEGVYHSMEGFAIFIVALVALLITHRILIAIANILEKRTGRTSHELPGIA